MRGSVGGMKGVYTHQTMKSDSHAQSQTCSKSDILIIKILPWSEDKVECSKSDME